mgnify:CR=1 FL=1
MERLFLTPAETVKAIVENGRRVITQSPMRTVALSLLAECPEARITCDAVRVTALVGRGDGGGARPLTAAQDAVRREEPGAASSRVKRVALERVLGAESVALLFVNGWTDPELPPPPVVVPSTARQLSLLSADYLNSG